MKLNLGLGFGGGGKMCVSLDLALEVVGEKKTQSDALQAKKRERDRVSQTGSKLCSLWAYYYSCLSMLL